MSQGKSYGRREDYTLGEFVLIAEAHRAASPPELENMAEVWALFVWSAETLHMYCVREGGMRNVDPALKLEWHHLSRIMHAWGYNPRNVTSCRDFDEDCKLAYRKLHGGPLQDEPVPGRE